MHIRVLHLTNFRGFENKTITFQSKFTALIGNNGRGKSTVLNGLQVALGAYLHGLEGVKYQRAIKDDEIRRIKDTKSRYYRPVLPCIVETTARFDGETQDTTWRRKILKEGGRTSFSAIDTHEVAYVAAKHMTLHRESMKPILPVFSAFSTTRGTGDVTKRGTTKFAHPIRDGYYAALESVSDFGSVHRWLRRYESALRDGLEFEGTIQAVFKAIEKAIPYLSEVKLDQSSGQIEALCSMPDQDPVRLIHEYMSDGVYNMVKMVAEIGYRCAQLNGHLGIDCIEKSSGVIMIDELDMHLHPNWQRHVVHDLKDAFPALQFVVTTHSPFILQSMKKEDVIMLDNEDDAIHPEDDPNKKGIEDISEDEMNVENVARSEDFLEMEKVASEYYNLLEEGKNLENSTVVELREKLNQLEERFNEDPAALALLKSERKASGL
jgi:predicted ATP-binding protein involved in virulence